MPLARTTAPDCGAGIRSRVPDSADELGTAITRRTSAISSALMVALISLIWSGVRPLSSKKLNDQRVPSSVLSDSSTSVLVENRPPSTLTDFMYS
jgi:hypothetical protein